MEAVQVSVENAGSKQRSKIDIAVSESSNPRPTGPYYRLKRWWLLDGPTYRFLFVFFAITIILFLERFLYYNLNPKGDKFFDIMDQGVAFARGCAAALRWTTCMILLAVSRNFLTWMQETWIGNWIPLYKAIDFHKVAAVVSLFFALVHTGAHLSNMWHISHSSFGDLKDAFGSDVWSEKPTFITLLFIPRSISYIPAITGWIILLCMAIMYSMAPNYVRAANFELFWYSHHLFIVFYACLIVHGTANLLEFPVYWAWFLVPGTIFAIERFSRWRRKKLPTDVVRATQKSCGVLGLELRKPQGFKYRAGGYMFVNCPALSKFEYHPFTITSSPDEDVISFHIRSAGDWTTALYELFDDKARVEGIKFNIDGPFGAPSEEFDKFEYVVLVGGGIGVTPCASILKDLKFRIQAGKNIAIKKIHFFWVAAEIGAFEWFRDMLTVLQQEEGVENILEIQGFCTRSKPEDLKSAAFPIHASRPNFDKIFGAMAEQYPGKRIGVFFCGPATLDEVLAAASRKHTSANGTQFMYHKENF